MLMLPDRPNTSVLVAVAPTVTFVVLAVLPMIVLLAVTASAEKLPVPPRALPNEPARDTLAAPAPPWIVLRNPVSVTVNVEVSPLPPNTLARKPLVATAVAKVAPAVM